MTLDALVFQRPGGGRVKVDTQPLVLMHEFRQVAAHQHEAGGIMMGRHLLACDDAVIDEVTCPLPGDQRGRLTFYRDAKRHQAVIDARWARSHGTCLYLGEWHTHPEPWPTPSRVDTHDWLRRLNEVSFDGESLFFLIVGTQGVKAWEGLRHSRRIVPLPRWQPPAHAYP